MSDPEQERTDDDLGFALPQPAVLGRTRGVAIAAGLAAMLIAAFVIGYLPRRHARQELLEEIGGAERARQRVEVIRPKPVAGDHAIVLSGSIQALEETVIYPRADGYLKRWLVDIGDKVAEGQLLAEIDTPEVDKELAQARAQLAQAKAAVAQSQANRALSKVTLERYQKLVAQHLVADADVDQKRAQALADAANVSAATANQAASKANLGRLASLHKYARVTAPFAGTITARSVDRGALVTGQTPLFKLAAVDTLRVFIQVPQDLAPGVHADMPAQVTVREHPERPFPGKVARAAGALDPVSRTMNTEVRVPNHGGELLPGMYAQVALSLPVSHRVLEVPATAIFNDSNGVRVAVVDPAGKIGLVPVVIERDTGAAIEIASGLSGDERVVKLASATLSEGTPVEVIVATP